MWEEDVRRGCEKDARRVSGTPIRRWMFRESMKFAFSIGSRIKITMIIGYRSRSPRGVFRSSSKVRADYLAHRQKSARIIFSAGNSGRHIKTCSRNAINLSSSRYFNWIMSRIIIYLFMIIGQCLVKNLLLKHKLIICFIYYDYNLIQSLKLSIRYSIILWLCILLHIIEFIRTRHVYVYVLLSYCLALPIIYVVFCLFLQIFSKYRLSHVVSQQLVAEYIRRVVVSCESVVVSCESV